MAIKINLKVKFCGPPRLAPAFRAQVLEKLERLVVTFELGERSVYPYPNMGQSLGSGLSTAGHSAPKSAENIDMFASVI